jgi:hypothetical protein
MPVGQWLRFRVSVSPTGISWTRSDQATPSTIAVSDTTFRGGYLHIGRSSLDGSLSFRKLSVS